MKLSGKVGSWRVDKIYLFLICTSCMIRLIVCYFNTMLPLATRIAGRECYQIGARGDGGKKVAQNGRPVARTAASRCHCLFDSSVCRRRCCPCRCRDWRCCCCCSYVVVVLLLLLLSLLLCLFSLLFAEFVIYQKKEKNPKRNDNKNV